MQDEDDLVMDMESIKEKVRKGTTTKREIEKFHAQKVLSKFIKREQQRQEHLESKNRTNHN